MSRQNWKDGQRKSAEATKEMQREFDNMWEQKLSLKKILYAHNIPVDKCGRCAQYFARKADFTLAYEFFCDPCRKLIEED